MSIYVPHALSSALEQKGGHWLSPSRILKYQVVLMEQDDVKLKTTSALNPALFLTIQELKEEPLTRDCLLTIEQVNSSRPDLHNEPFKNPDYELFRQ